jgi:hypothetical protein
MKKISFILLFFVQILIQIFSQISVLAQSKLANIPFKKGENCTYSLSVDGIEVGEATIQITNEIVNIGGKNCNKIQASGKAIGATSLVADIKNQFYSWIDFSMVAPKKFQAYIKGRSNNINEIIEFNQGTQKATIYDPTQPEKKTTLSISPNSQDALSGFYFIRNLDFEKMPLKTIFSMSIVADNKVTPVEFQYLGKKSITTVALGTKEAYILMPILRDVKGFQGGSVRLSISADGNQVPLKLLAKTDKGFISVELKSFQAGR